MSELFIATFEIMRGHKKTFLNFSKGLAMRVDIYRRPEHAGHFSYLAVPEGKRIPEEVINTDWEQTDRGIVIEDDAKHLADFAIDDPLAQIKLKGYAITSIKELSDTPQS